MPSRSTRRLIWVPIVHTEADLGSMGGSVRGIYVRRFGKGAWQKHIQTVEEMWARIREEIERLELDYSRVRLYQDGLPDCGREAEIVRHLAQAGSQNHLLLLELMERGARVMGAEAPELLVEEYELARQTMLALRSEKTQRLTGRQKKLSKGILEQRDRYIADRINQTLRPGETGLLFLGLLHSVDEHLPGDIEAVCLFDAPRQPGGAGTARRRRPGR